jgi:hypothetical protein
MNAMPGDVDPLIWKNEQKDERGGRFKKQVWPQDAPVR